MKPVKVVAQFVHDLESFRRSRPAFDDTTLVVVEVLTIRDDDIEVSTGS